MARKAMADLAAHVSINTVDARASISLLKRNIRELNQEWKAEYHAQMAAGHGADAMKAKAKGLIQVQNALKETLSKVNNAISNSSGEKGSQAYRKTTLDAKQLENQLTKNQAQVQNTNRAMELHSDELNKVSNQERYNREITDANVQTYKNEGNSIEANRYKLGGYNRELTLLAQKRKELAESLQNYRNSNGETTGNRDYENTLVELQRVKSLEEQVKNEQHDLNSGLTNGVKYDNLYNQSTNKVIASLKGMKDNAEANRIEYQRLTGNIDREGHTLDAEKAKVDRIAKANITASDATGHQSIAFQKENAKLAALNATYNQHVYKIGRLSHSYGALSANSTASMDRMQHKIDALNTSSSRWLNSARAMTGPSLALGAAFLYGSKQAIGLENQFNYVRNLLNTSGETYRQSTREIHEMGRATAQYSMEYGISQRQIARGYTDLVKRGYSGRQALESQKTYLQGAIASGDKYNDVMDTAASTLEAFGMRSNNSRKMVNNTKIAVNQLAYAADKTATDFKGIGYGMKFTGATAHSANQSLSETSSALGVLSNNGQNATNAGFGLRKVLNSFIAMKDTKSWKKILPQLGLSAKDFQTANGHLKSLSDMMALLQSHTRKLSDAQRVDVFHQLFGATGQESALILARNTGNLSQLNDQVARSQDQDKHQGYAARIANKNMNSTQNQLERLKQAGIELSKEYAQGLNPEFKRAANITLGLAHHLAKAPKPIKDIVAAVSLGIPVFTALGFALGGIQRAYSAFYQIQRYGILGFLRNTDNAKQNSLAISDNISKLNAATLAQRQNNEAKQQGKNIDNEQTISLDRDSSSEKTNATATDTDTTSERNNSTSLKDNISSRMDLVKANAGNHFKSGAINGAMIGGTEALSGDPKDGAEDAIGVTAGGMIGGGLGDLTGNPAIGEIGSALGQTAGPIIAHAVGNKLTPMANHIGKSLDKNTKTQNGDIRNSIRGKEDNPKVQAATIRDLNSRKTALGRLFAGASEDTRKFVNSEAKNERKAEANYVQHRGRMTKAQRGYFNNMYKTAAAYEKRQTRNHQAELKHLYKDGDLTKREYQRESALLKRHENNRLKQLKKDENNLIKASSRNRSARLKALKKFNNDIAKETNAGNKKQLQLRRYLDRHEGKLDTKAYTKIMNASKRAYRNTVNNAKHGYEVKRRAAQREYRLDLSDARKRFGVHSRMYARIEARARSHEARQIRTAASQANRTESHARRQEDGVITAAGHQASSAVRSAYREDHESSSIFSSMASTVGSILSKISSAASAVGHSSFHRRALGTLDTQALHLAVGDLPGLSHTENSIINDGSGRELIKLPNGQLVLPSGHNIHTILPKGTSVFNAFQTRRLLNAISLLSSPTQHRASGTPDAGGFAGMAFGTPRSLSVGSLNGTVKDTKKSMDHIHDLIDSGYKDASDDAQKHLQDIHDNSDNIWNDTRKLTKKHTKDIHDDTSKKSKNLRDVINKYETQLESWSNEHLNTTVHFFRRHFSMIPPLTRSSMRAGVSNINSGISAIDRILTQFGGNSRVLGMVHYATGTSGPSFKKQLAVLNDATSGPQQEAIVSDQGRVRMPIGRNVVTALNPGDKVLNGSDTLRALKTGLIPHYAGGLHSDDALRKLADFYSKQPTTFTNQTFNRFAQLIGSILSKDITNSSKNGSQKPANAWSNAMWKYIDNLISGSNSKFLSYAEHTFSGIPYKYGAESMRSADCSGMIDMAARKFGIDLPHQTDAIAASPQVQYMGKSDPKPGYLAIFGHGGTTGHIGIALGNGSPMMFDETPPKAGITPLACGDALDGYYKLKGLPNDDENEVANNPLTPLVKRQLGRKASNWIYQNLGDAGMSNPSGTGVKRWREAVIKALQKNGFPASSSQVDSWLQVINRETGGTGDPGLTNHNDSNAAAGHPSEGLVQTIGPTFDAFKFPGHNNIFNGYDDLLAGINYAASRYGRGSGMFSRVASAGYHNGGLSVTDKIARLSEGDNPEMVLPLTDKSRAVKLMLRSLQYMFGNSRYRSNNNTSGNDTDDAKFEHDLIASDRHKSEVIDKLLFMIMQISTNSDAISKNSKITLRAIESLINTVRNKPVLSNGQIYHANRSVAMKKLHLRNLNRGNF